MTVSRLRRLPPLILLASVLGGCGFPADEPPAQESSTEQASQEGASTGLAPVGKVLETLEGGGYTYARLTAGDREIWVAGPQSEVAVGDLVSLHDTVRMEDFPSRSLDRTFEELFFLGRFDLLPRDAAHGVTKP